jgi:hypothetical protein
MFRTFQELLPVRAHPLLSTYFSVWVGPIQVSLIQFAGYILIVLDNSLSDKIIIAIGLLLGNVSFIYLG